LREEKFFEPRPEEKAHIARLFPPKISSRRLFSVKEPANEFHDSHHSMTFNHGDMRYRKFVKANCITRLDGNIFFAAGVNEQDGFFRTMFLR